MFLRPAATDHNEGTQGTQGEGCRLGNEVETDFAQPDVAGTPGGIRGGGRQEHVLRVLSAKIGHHTAGVIGELFARGIVWSPR